MYFISSLEAGPYHYVRMVRVMSKSNNGLRKTKIGDIYGGGIKKHVENERY